MCKVGILLIVDSLSGGGGAERRFARIWDYLSRRCSDRYYLIINKNLFDDLVKIRAISSRSNLKNIHILYNSNCLFVFWEIYTCIKKNNLSVLHFPLVQKRLLPLYIILAVKRLFSNKPYITHTVASSCFAYKTKTPFFMSILSKMLWYLSDRIDSLYPGFIDTYAKPMRLNNKVTVSPCSFTDISRFHGNAKKEKIIVFAGRLIDEKNPLLLVDAVKILSEEVFDWQIVLAGDGPLKQEVKRKIESLNLCKYIDLICEPDMSEILNKSKIFLSIQKTENYPSQSLIEAMSAKNAIIATDVGETRRLVHNGFNGFLVCENSVELAKRIKQLIENPSLCDKFSNNSQSIIQEGCNIEIFSNYISKFWRFEDME